MPQGIVVDTYRYYHYDGGMNTGEVATLLGITEPRIQQLIRWKKFVPPPKTGGKRKWSEKDVDRLRGALRRNA